MKYTETVPSLMQTARALLSAGESVILQGQLKKMFGLDTLDITTPPGGDEVSCSMVTIGKYPTPKLYIRAGSFDLHRCHSRHALLHPF